MWAGSGFGRSLYKQTGGLPVTFHSINCDHYICIMHHKNKNNLIKAQRVYIYMRLCIIIIAIATSGSQHLQISQLATLFSIAHLLRIVFSSLCCWSSCWSGSRRCPPHGTKIGHEGAEARPEKPAGKTLTSTWTTSWNTNTKLAHTTMTVKK